MKYLAALLSLMACSADSAQSAPRTCATQDATAIGTGFTLGADPLGYASFAVDGCVLYYVTKEGALAKRTKGQNDVQIVDPASQAPRRPSVRAGLLVWEYTENGVSRVATLDTRTGERKALTGPFVAAGEPRSTGTGVVFTGWRSATVNGEGDTDVFLAPRGNDVARVLFEGPGQQRFADGAGDVFAMSDFAEDPSGEFSLREARLSDVVIQRGDVTLKRAKSGKQAFPLVFDSGEVAYLDWESIHPEPKLQGYTLFRAAVDRPPTEDVRVGQIESRGRYLRPSAVESALFYISDGTLNVQVQGEAAQTFTTGTFAAVVGSSRRDAMVMELGVDGSPTLRSVAR